MKRYDWLFGLIVPAICAIVALFVRPRKREHPQPPRFTFDGRKGKRIE